MSRDSRIPRPPGSRFIKIYASDLRRFGLAVAAVVSEIEFLDRAQELPGQPVASRARLIADLEGIVGRDQVDRALRMLQDARVIKAHPKTERGEKNWRTRVEYGLDLVGLERIFSAAGTPAFRSSGNSGNQDSRELLKAGRKTGVPSNQEEVEVTTTTNHPVVVDDLEDLIEAGVWAEGLARPVRNEAGLRRKIRTRLVAEGPNAEDLLALRAWRAHRDRAASEHEQRERELAAATEREQQRAAQAAEASAYLQSLDEASHAALVDEFAAHLAASNGHVYQIYRRQGLRPKIVESALLAFTSTYVSRNRQEATT